MEQQPFLMPDLDQEEQNRELSPDSLARYNRRQEKKEKAEYFKTQQSRKAHLLKLKAKHKHRLKRKFENMADSQYYELKREKIQRKKKEKDNAIRGMKEGLPIYIDCSYDSDMNDFERRSLVEQIRLTYTHMRTAQKPASIHVCGLAQSYDPLLKKLSLQQVPIIFDKELPAKDSLVYLSPDAEKELTALQFKEAAGFVIGGLIDRTVLKEASVIRAWHVKLECRRLPVDQFLGFKRCLNIDTVAHMIVAYHSCGDWKAAFEKSVPTKNIRGVEEKRVACGE